jgi:hypothetical protein
MAAEGTIQELRMKAPKLPSSGSPRDSYDLRPYKLDDSAQGVITTIDNILVMTVWSEDEGAPLRAEYRAGFVQGKLQERTIISARDNSWDNDYLTDPDSEYKDRKESAKGKRDLATSLLMSNYRYFLQYLSKPESSPGVVLLLKRLYYRMIGIYHGATRDSPDYAGIDFLGKKVPGVDYFASDELELHYEAKELSFLDVYFLNAFNDLEDAMTASPESQLNNKDKPGDGRESCSAFLARRGKDIILTHNSWMGFLSQTMCQTICVNGLWHSENAGMPGLIGSGTDFGYNSLGLMYNETTHRCSRPRFRQGLWLFWRAAMAEQYSGTIDEFFDLLSVDNTGTYLNGYMVAEAKTGKTGLAEMSYRCFAFYRSQGDGSYDIEFKASDEAPNTRLYDAQMVAPQNLLGINYPASQQVLLDLWSSDNRPERRQQFLRFLPSVETIEDAKDLITYTDPANPLSLFGRWDLGYGKTDYPKTIPDGSVDAKAVTMTMVRQSMKLAGRFDLESGAKGFWMLFGTARARKKEADGSLAKEAKPFAWSESQWKDKVELRDVPDLLDGKFAQIPLSLS